MGCALRVFLFFSPGGSGHAIKFQRAPPAKVFFFIGLLAPPLPRGGRLLLFPTGPCETIIFLGVIRLWWFRTIGRIHAQLKNEIVHGVNECSFQPVHQ